MDGSPQIKTSGGVRNLLISTVDLKMNGVGGCPPTGSGAGSAPRWDTMGLVRAARPRGSGRIFSMRFSPMRPERHGELTLGVLGRERGLMTMLDGGAAAPSFGSVGGGVRCSLMVLRLRSFVQQWRNSDELLHWLVRCGEA
jgi:hypothetical protein